MQTPKAAQSAILEQELESTSQPQKVLKHANIQVRNSPIHHYGVFANELILPGEIIEECPVILLNKYQEPLVNYVFEWDDKKAALALGNGSIYNHSDTPNAGFKLGNDQTLRVYAIKPIYCNDEIFIDYGKNWFPFRSGTARTDAKQAKRAHLRRITFLVILLIFIYSFVPTFAKFRVPPFPVITNVLHKWHLERWEMPSTAPRIQMIPTPAYTTEHNETN